MGEGQQVNKSERERKSEGERKRNMGDYVMVNRMRVLYGGESSNNSSSMGGGEVGTQVNSVRVTWKGTENEKKYVGG